MEDFLSSRREGEIFNVIPLEGREESHPLLYVEVEYTLCRFLVRNFKSITVCDFSKEV